MKTTTETVQHPTTKKTQTRTTITDGHRTVVIFAPQGDKVHAVGFNGGDDTASASRHFCGRMWSTPRGAIKAAIAWIAASPKASVAS